MQSNTGPICDKEEPGNNWIETGAHVMIVGSGAGDVGWLSTRREGRPNEAWRDVAWHAIRAFDAAGPLISRSRIRAVRFCAARAMNAVHYGLLRCTSPDVAHNRPRRIGTNVRFARGKVDFIQWAVGATFRPDGGTPTPSHHKYPRTDFGRFIITISSRF